MSILNEAIGMFGNWRDQLVEASWRGVSFYMEQSEALFGRKIKVTTPWGLDGAFIEDSGQAPEEFMVVGYIIANSSNNFNYLKQKEQLIDRLRQGERGSNKMVGATHSETKKKFNRVSDWGFTEPGTLCHPYYGELECVLKEPARIIETSKEGGICRFEATFIKYQVEISAGIPGASLGDYVGAIDEVAIKAMNNAIDTFGKAINLGGAFVGYMGNILRNVMGGIQRAISSIQGAVGSVLSNTFGIVSDAIGFADSVLSAPCDIASLVGTSVDGILSCCGMAGSIIEGGIAGLCSGELRGNVYELDGSSVPQNLALSVIRAYMLAQDVEEEDLDYYPAEQEDNASMIIDLFKCICMIDAVRVAIRGDYQSQERATSAKEIISNYLDALLIRLGSRDIDNSLMSQGMEELFEVFVRAMDEKILGLKQETEYTVPSDGESALTLAYGRFEDVYRESEIISMNRVPAGNPLFLPAGDEIVVLDS